MWLTWDVVGCAPLNDNALFFDEVLDGSWFVVEGMDVFSRALFDGVLESIDSIRVEAFDDLFNGLKLVSYSVGMVLDVS